MVLICFLVKPASNICPIFPLSTSFASRFFVRNPSTIRHIDIICEVVDPKDIPKNFFDFRF